MSEKPKRYWMSLVERDAPHEIIGQAVNGDPDLLTTRRSFLKAAGFTFAGAVAAGCSRAPATTAIPFARQPEGLVPGRPLLYASTCGACEARCGVLVTTRDGRPLKIEGNPDHPLSGGATCAVGQASVLGLYDSLRLKGPLRRGQPATWAEVDSGIVEALGRLRQDGGALRVLTPTITSPTTAALIADFLSGFANARHISYDPLSASAVLDAHALTHGARLVPQYRFDRADVIVSFDADFLGTWISPVQYTRGYARGRRVDVAGLFDGTQARPAPIEGRPTQTAPAMSYHVQIESRVSLSGSNADRRLRVAPGDMGHVATHLAMRLAQRAGVPFPTEGLEPSPVEPTLEAVADRLWAARGRGLVIAASQDVGIQLLCNFMNNLIGAYGATLDLERPSFQRQGSDRELAELRRELARGEVAALFVAGVNPVYDLPDATGLTSDLQRAPLLVSAAERLDETASLASFVCPVPHYLESWDDAEAVSGVVSLTQPTIAPLGDTRSLLESVSLWTTGSMQPALDLIRGHWERAIYPRATGTTDTSGTVEPFQTFWDRTLERGVAEIAPREQSPASRPTRARPSTTRPPFDGSAVKPILRPDAPPSSALALVLYPAIGMLDGRHGHNAWLHELPDPVTKVTWDNYASLSPAAAQRLGVQDGDVVRVVADGSQPIELPAFVQPGQHDGCVAIALGYGRAGTDRFANVGPPWFLARRQTGLVGINAAPLVSVVDDTRRYSGRAVTVARIGRTRPLASTQVHHSLAVPTSLGSLVVNSAPRPIVQEVTLGQLSGPSSAGTTATGATAPADREHARDLWPADHPYPEHRWGMAIDLNACTGCSACVIACQAENNIPVVGHDEVRRRRGMHWIRIDRYYAGTDDEIEVAHQPMLCQHCGHAPCETVCPVLATTHSDEGLNQQIYNRCVGTRYCANNCPYKVRRFNWFDYPHEDRLQNLVFNPNVTVRSRGVMEKCTFCVQRIGEARIEARRLGQPLADGAIKTACQQVCPAEAIVFGDLRDPNSRAATLARSQRAYRVLEDLGTEPGVHYLKLVRHTPDTRDGKRNG